MRRRSTASDRCSADRACGLGDAAKYSTERAGERAPRQIAYGRAGPLYPPYLIQPAEHSLSDPQPSQLEKALEIIGKFSSIIVTYGFAAGICLLAGEIGAVGKHAYYFIGVGDVVSRSISALATTMLLSAFAIYFRVVTTTGTGNKKASNPEESLTFFRVILIAIAVITAILFFVTDTPTFAGLFLVTVFFFSFLMFVTESAKYGGRAPAHIGMFGRLVCLCVCIYAYGYATTTWRIFPATPVDLPSHSLCVGERCRPAVLITRLSDYFVVRFMGENRVAFVRADTVTSMNELAQRKSELYFDLRSWLHGLWA